MTFVLYCKSNCPACDKAKMLLQTEETVIINCDELLVNDREAFLREIRKKTNMSRIMFPLIFLNDVFLGGIDELSDYMIYEMNYDF